MNQLLSYMGHRLGGIKRANIDCDDDEEMSLEALDAAAHTPTLFRIAILMISAASLGKEAKNAKMESDETLVRFTFCVISLWSDRYDEHFNLMGTHLKIPIRLLA